MRKTTRIDLHTHTRGSDGTGTPEAIAAAAVEAGLDGVCITDHHKTYTKESLEVAKALRAAGLMVFHGCEYSTADGHLLVYGVNIEDLGLGYYPPMQEVIDEVNRRGGVCVPAHPYQGYKRYLDDKVHELTGVPAIETANGQCTYRCPHNNRKAVKAAKTMGVRSTGGSDAHVARGVGLTYTEFQGNITSEREFVEALRHGQYRAVTSRKRVEEELERRRPKSWELYLDKLGPRYDLDDLFQTSEVASDLDNFVESRQVRGDASDPISGSRTGTTKH